MIGRRKMKGNKKIVSLNLSEGARVLLERLSEESGESKSALADEAIRAFAKRHKVELPEPVAAGA